jgi:hypothetical protein
LEEVSPSRCKGGSEDVSFAWIFILLWIMQVKDAHWVERSYLMVSILVPKEECMFLLMVTILALSCPTSFWVSVKAEDKELKWSSKSWLRVWAMMKGKTERHGWDHTEKGLWVKGITTIRAMRGFQWGKAQIRGLEGVWVHEISFC